MSDQEAQDLGLEKATISIDEFVKIIRRKLAKESLAETRIWAHHYGLDKLTMDEISSEVREVRKNAKGHS